MRFTPRAIPASPAEGPPLGLGHHRWAS